jgi:hypothetical protein
LTGCKKSVPPPATGANGPLIRTYQISNEIASTISGVTRTRKISAMNKIVHLPGRRASAMPASEPSTVAMIAAPTAAFSDVVIVSKMTWLWGKLRYQSTPNPSHANRARPLLKENATIITIGRNRKT